MIGQTFRWIQGGKRGGESDNYCEGTLIGIVAKGDSLFRAYPRKIYLWRDYIVDVSARYSRAVLKNMNKDGAEYFVAQMSKISQPVSGSKENNAKGAVAHPPRQASRKFLRRPG